MRHRGYGRAVLPSRSGPPTVSGRWSLLPPREPDQTRRLHALALTLLDRHGIVTRGATGSERVSGGFGALYPVLRAMEESGQCRRGYFVEGLGAAQFALTGAVDRMRALADALPADQDAGPPAAAPPASAAGGQAAASAATNSGNPPSGRNSTSPSAFTKVLALSRPSAIHLRMSSAETRLYSFWSPPMTVYLAIVAPGCSGEF
jgi:ATP-dependent Lhr-like helicase